MSCHFVHFVESYDLVLLMAHSILFQVSDNVPPRPDGATKVVDHELQQRDMNQGSASGTREKFAVYEPLPNGSSSVPSEIETE